MESPRKGLARKRSAIELKYADKKGAGPLESWQGKTESVSPQLDL